MRKLSVIVIFLTIWFKNSSFFSIYYFIWDYLLDFLYFSFFCRYVLNACDLPASTSEVQCGGWKWFGQVHEPWNSMEPTMTNPRNELHSLDRASHMHSDRCNKKMKNIKNPRDRPEQSKNREKNAAFEPDGQNNYDGRQFSHVSTSIKISYVKFKLVHITENWK